MNDISVTLRATMGDNQPAVCYPSDENVNPPVRCFRKSSKPRAPGGLGERWVEDDVTNTLNCFEFDNDTRTPEIIMYPASDPPVIALEGNGARPSHRGAGFSDSGVMFTLNTIEQHSVCYEEIK